MKATEVDFRLHKRKEKEFYKHDGISVCNCWGDFLYVKVQQVRFKLELFQRSE